MESSQYNTDTVQRLHPAESKGAFVGGTAANKMAYCDFLEAFEIDPRPDTFNFLYWKFIVGQPLIPTVWDVLAKHCCHLFKSVFGFTSSL